MEVYGVVSMGALVFQSIPDAAADTAPLHTSVAVSNLIQHNGADILPLNDAPAQVHFCTPLITMPYAPLWEFNLIQQTSNDYYLKQTLLDKTAWDICLRPQ